MMLMTLQSCIEEYNAVLPEDEINLLVVEGTIISDTLSTFSISHTVGLNDKFTGTQYSGAQLIIKGSDGLELKVPWKERNEYAVRVPKLNPEAEYSLWIIWDGDTYVTDPQKPLPSNPIENVTFNQPKKYGNIDILVTTAAPKDPKETQYYRWFYTETWEVHAQYMTIVEWDAKTKKAKPLEKEYQTIGWCDNIGRDIIASSSAYYNDNKIVEYKLFDIDATNRRLERLYSTEVIQRSISKAEYEYEVERRRIGMDMGGLFTPLPSVLPTNIHCTTSSKRAIGYVGCSAGYVRKRIFISPEDVYCAPDTRCDAYYSDQKEFPGNEALYAMGCNLIEYVEEQGLYGWAHNTCLDVSGIGAKPEKPAYWPTK